MAGLTRARLAAAGLALPDAPRPRGSYAPCSVTQAAEGLWVRISGQASRQDGVPLAGLCLGEADVALASHAARQAMLASLAILADACGGELDRVRQVARLRGYIRGGPDFTQHSAVLDGASRVLEIAFPDMPRPARTVVGVASLPERCWVEIELTALADPS